MHPCDGAAISTEPYTTFNDTDFNVDPQGYSYGFTVLGSSDGDCEWGTFGAKHEFKGLIAEVRQWNRALTQDEILALNAEVEARWGL